MVSKCAWLGLMVLIVSCFVAGTVSAQVVEGVISDDETGEPVPFASVYLANTLTGTSTLEDGTYRLKAFSPGKYILTISSVGYATIAREILLEKDQVLQVNLRLSPQAISLPAIYVKADTSNREAYFEFFKRYFIGTNRASNGCEILNPRTLFFYHDQLRQKFYAHARRPVQIRNEYLGYLVTYDMKSFVFDLNDRKVNYIGIPRYELLDVDHPKKRWIKNRRRTYMGSPTHFFRSLYNNTLDESGFRVTILHRTPNPDILPDPVIRNKIAYYEKRVAGRNTSLRYRSITADQDSLQHYRNMLTAPRYTDTPGAPITQASDLMEENIITYQGWLVIEYRGYISQIHITDQVRVYENGYYEDILSVFTDGYWGNEYTVSTMLPLDYMLSD